jgi:hypothetical protein
MQCKHGLQLHHPAGAVGRRAAATALARVSVPTLLVLALRLFAVSGLAGGLAIVAYRILERKMCDYPIRISNLIR